MSKSSKNNTDDKDQIEIKIAMADCLIQWSLIESLLSMTLDRTAKVMPTVGHAIWLSIVNFNSRIDTLDAVLEKTHLEPENRQIWTILSKRIRGASKRRNKIAHATPVTITSRGKLKPVLSPNFSPKAPENEYFSAKDVNGIVADFKKLNEALGWFYFSVPMKRDRFLKHLVQAPSLIVEIQNLNNPNPKGK